MRDMTDSISVSSIISILISESVNTLFTMDRSDLFLSDSMNKYRIVRNDSWITDKVPYLSAYALYKTFLDFWSLLKMN